MVSRENKEKSKQFISLIPLIFVLTLVLLISFYDFNFSMLFGFMLFLPTIFVDHILKSKITSTGYKMIVLATWAIIVIVFAVVIKEYHPSLVGNSIAPGGFLGLSILPIKRAFIDGKDAR